MILPLKSLPPSVTHWGPSIKYVMLFLPIFAPLPCHTLSHIPGPPKKYVTNLGPPFLLGLGPYVVKKFNLDKSPLYKFSLNCSRGFLSGRFCPGWYLSVPSSVRIHLLQHKVKHHFKFHVPYV